ncbi:MAG: hypothetical protein HUJ96_04205 [Marinilabiliaceae bacterium]|nr:hypothetical protein [Marinilabiliaceae bacterium]
MSDNITDITKKFKITGNFNLIYSNKIKTFLCSRIVPNMLVDRILEWASSIDANEYCVVCGNQTHIEFEVIERLLKGNVPVILVLSTRAPETFQEEVEKALSENRILIFSQPDDEKISTVTSQYRNELMFELANDGIVVGFCSRGGNLAQQTMFRDDVTYLTDYKMLDESADYDLWKKSFQASDNSMITLQAKTVRGVTNYVSLTKAFRRQGSGEVEYQTINFLERDLKQLYSFLGQAVDAIEIQEMTHRNRSSQKNGIDYKSESGDRMPWDD